MRLVRFFVLMCLLVGGACAPADRERPAPDAQAAKRDYDAIRSQAREDMVAWQAAGGQGSDPRPRWASELEAFIRDHPGTQEAADASLAAMDLYAESREVAGFFRAWDLALENAADEPGFRTSFERIGLMRMVEAGGLGVLISHDPASRERAWRQAAPRIVGDMERAIEATSSRETYAAAHYTIARTWYQLDLAPKKALNHFRIVAEEYPEWAGAESARMYVRELEQLSPGQEAPGFSGRTLDGKSLDLASYRGQVVLLDFFASWCEPCVEQIPRLKQIRRRYREQGFEIIGINLDEDLDAAKGFVETHAIPWPVVAHGDGMLDPLATEYSVQSIPTAYLLGRDGKIVVRGFLGDSIVNQVTVALAMPVEREP